MSAHTYKTRKRTTRFFLLFIAVLGIAVTPLAAHADTLPVNVVERQTCLGTTVDIKASGTGMLEGFEPIQASLPRLATVDATSGCAVIHWETSAPAATSIVVTEFGAHPIAVDISKENYGYTLATPQNNSGEASHTTIITGLKAGKTYAYRLVARAHPTALPVISEARVLVVPTIGALVVPLKPVVVVPPTSTQPVVPPVVPTPTPPVTTPPTIEKQPTTTTPDKGIGDGVSISATGDLVYEHATPEAEPDEGKVSSASTAAESALGEISQERAFVASLRNWYETTKSEGLVATLLTYSFVTLLAIGGVALLYMFIAPKMTFRIKNPLMFGLLGATLLAILSATFMLYYVTLVSIAAFLAILAWYLLTSIPLEDIDATPTQPKLLESTESKHKHETTKS